MSFIPELQKMSEPKPFYDGVYVGQMDGSKRHGKGVMNYKDGTKYEGEWENDSRHGRGIFTWPDNSRYEGEFVTGRVGGESKGVYFNSSGQKCDATWISACTASSYTSPAS